MLMKEMSNRTEGELERVGGMCLRKPSWRASLSCHLNVEEPAHTNLGGVL